MYASTYGKEMAPLHQLLDAKIVTRLPMDGQRELHWSEKAVIFNYMYQHMTA